jgi:hypothetical protein
MLPDFLANLAATLIAVVLGIPLALWLNGEASHQADSARRRAERHEIDYALDELGSAIAENVPRLKRLIEILDRNEVLFDLGLDAETWDAVQRSLTAEWRDTALRRQLAYYFNRLNAVSRLNERYIDVSVGVSSTLTNRNVIRATLQSTMHAAARQLVAEAVALQRDLGEARKRLGGPYEHPRPGTA